MEQYVYGSIIFSLIIILVVCALIKKTRLKRYKNFNNLHNHTVFIICAIYLLIFVWLGGEFNNILYIANKTFIKSHISIAIILYLYTIMYSCMEHIVASKAKSSYKNKIQDILFFINEVGLGTLLPAYVLEHIHSLHGLNMYIVYKGFYPISNTIPAIGYALCNVAISIVMISLLYKSAKVIVLSHNVRHIINRINDYFR